jgi:hypothetical protein
MISRFHILPRVVVPETLLADDRTRLQQVITAAIRGGSVLRVKALSLVPPRPATMRCCSNAFPEHAAPRTVPPVPCLALTTAVRRPYRR